MYVSVYGKNESDALQGFFKSVGQVCITNY